MLAPRKKLWSTPIEVVSAAVSALDSGSELTNAATIFDVGAGDGRFVLACAEAHPLSRGIGVEIDKERGQHAIDSLTAHGFSQDDESVRVKFVIGNALEQDYSTGTHFFLYLVPRGLRIMLPILLNVAKASSKRNIRVVTYMAPFVVNNDSQQEREQVKLLEIIKTSTASHPDAQWPLYVYDIIALPTET